ncbi:hypothetical protein [Halovenus halobia]|uniref:hypothetical protein n=1 Tax=Halovenus halobia TaxID=3396622 RepID=UPI003F57B0C0
MPTIDEVVAEAKLHPVEVDVPHTLSYLFLEDYVNVFHDGDVLESYLNNPSYEFNKNVVLKTQSDVGVGSQYPKLKLDHSPISPLLNNIIAEKYDRLSDHLITQRDIKSQILQRVTDETVVVLLIADGLGYDDVLGTQLEGEPCLVNGPTITPVGYQNVVYGRDNTPIIDELINRGFVQVRGYSYWDESTYNDLNSKVFENFHEVNRVRTTEEILEDLQKNPIGDDRTYIQISRQVLDRQAHDGKEIRTSDHEHEISKLNKDIGQLNEILEEQVDSHLIVVTGDHGILWRKDFEQDMQIVSTNGKSSMRYAGQQIGFDGGAKLIDAFDSTYTVFDYPYAASSFDADEAGTHGGLSYYESLVPLHFRGSRW